MSYVCTALISIHPYGLYSIALIFARNHVYIHLVEWNLYSIFIKCFFQLPHSVPFCIKKLLDPCVELDIHIDPAVSKFIYIQQYLFILQITVNILYHIQCNSLYLLYIFPYLLMLHQKLPLYLKYLDVLHLFLLSFQNF